MSKQTCTHCGLMTPNLGLHLEVAHKKQETERLQKQELEQLQAQAQRQQKATNNVIVIYEEVPESLKVYTLRVTNEELDLLQEAHNDFVDPSERDESWVFKFLKNYESAYSTDRADGAPVLNCGDNTIICTGVMGDEPALNQELRDKLLGFSAQNDDDDEESDDDSEEDASDEDDSDEN